MPCKTETKNIEGHDYSVTQWPAHTAMINKFKLIKMFGPAFLKFAPLMGSTIDTDSDEAMRAMSSSLNLLFENGSPEEIASLIESCIIGASRDGLRIDSSGYMQHFSGDGLSSIYKVFMFVVQVNYSDLMPGSLLKGQLPQ
jgi:hypothetical protein